MFKIFKIFLRSKKFFPLINSIWHFFQLFFFLQLVLVNPLGEVMEKLQKAEETSDMMKLEKLYLTVGEAVALLSSSMKGQSSTTTAYGEATQRDENQC